MRQKKTGPTRSRFLGLLPHAWSGSVAGCSGRECCFFLCMSRTLRRTHWTCARRDSTGRRRQNEDSHHSLESVPASAESERHAVKTKEKLELLKLSVKKSMKAEQGVDWTTLEADGSLTALGVSNLFMKWRLMRTASSRVQNSVRWS